MNVKGGDKISVVQDEESPDDWYLLTNDENGFALREYKGNKGLCFNNSFICKEIIKFMEVEASSISFKVATEPAQCDVELPKKCKLFALLISSAEYVEIQQQEEELETEQQD